MAIEIGDKFVVTEELVRNSFPNGEMRTLVGKELQVEKIPNSTFLIAGGYAWSIKSIKATLPTMTFSAACEAYTAACVRFEQAQEELERAKAAVADARIMVERALEQEPAP